MKDDHYRSINSRVTPVGGDARFEFTPEELKRFENRWKSDVDLKLDNMNRRLQTIERLVWTAVGGTAVVASIAIVGINIVIRQGDRLDAVSLKQAHALAERAAHVEGLKNRDAELQMQIDRMRAANGK